MQRLTELVLSVEFVYEGHKILYFRFTMIKNNFIVLKTLPHATSFKVWLDMTVTIYLCIGKLLFSFNTNKDDSLQSKRIMTKSHLTNKQKERKFSTIIEYCNKLQLGPVFSHCYITK